MKAPEGAAHGPPHARRYLAPVSLLLLAVASGIAWRVELNTRSRWASLAWIRYFHWAVPICASAFLVWVVWVARVRRPYWFALALTAFASTSYIVVAIALNLYFSAGPSAMGVVFLLGRGDLETGFRLHQILHYVSPILWGVLPMCFCGLCRAFGIQISFGATLLSSVLFTLSWPVAILIRGFFEDLGSPDLIHALKSGFVIPFLVFSLGLPLLRFSAVRRRASQSCLLVSAR